MRKPRLFLLILLALMIAPGTALAKIRYVAVVETEVDEQSGAAAMLNKAEVRLMTTELRSLAVKNLPSDRYKIITSETVMAQGSAKLEECAEENCVISLGAKIGADYIVRGLVSKLGKNLTMSVEMYETKDGNLVATSGVVRSGDIADLVDKAAAVCADMYKKFASAQNPQPTPTYQQPQPTPYQQPQYQPAPTYQQQSNQQPPLPYQQQANQQPQYQPAPQTYQPPAPTPSKPSTVDASGILTDSRDGKRYKMVVIGGKRWMAENLNYQTRSGSWCYDNNNSNCGWYGRLYDWNTAKTACPAGWHLPSRVEWGALAKAAGGTGDYGASGTAGKKLKAGSGWKDNGNGTDDYGFSALPGGNRSYAGSFYHVGTLGFWWTATEYGIGAEATRRGSVYRRGMGYDFGYVDENGYYNGGGFSVRCVAD